MSILKVDTINEKTTGNGVIIPNHVIQVLTQEITAYTSTSSTSAVATGFTLTITPKSTSSKIKCTIGFNGFYANTTASAASIYLHKNGSFHKYLDSVTGYAHPSGQAHQSSNPTIMTVDSPSTTSAVTYAIFWKRNLGSGSVFFNNYATGNNETRSWFTVEEIAQ